MSVQTTDPISTVPGKLDSNPETRLNEIINNQLWRAISNSCLQISVLLDTAVHKIKINSPARVAGKQALKKAGPIAIL